MNEHANLEVHEQAARVEVRRAEQRNPFVDDHCLAVHHARLEEPDVRAGAHQLPQVVPAGEIGDGVVRARGHDQRDDAAGVSLHQQGTQQNFVRQKIRRHDPDASFRLLDHRDDAFVKRIARHIGTARDDLQIAIATRADHGLRGDFLVQFRGGLAARENTSRRGRPRSTARRRGPR